MILDETFYSLGAQRELKAKGENVENDDDQDDERKSRRRIVISKWKHSRPRIPCGCTLNIASPSLRARDKAHHK